MIEELEIQAVLQQIQKRAEVIIRLSKQISKDCDYSILKQLERTVIRLDDAESFLSVELYLKSNEETKKKGSKT